MTIDGRFAYEVVNGVPVVAAPEEIDVTNAPELRSALVEAARHGGGTLVVDMTRTRFCDSCGLHILFAAWHKRAQAEGGELRLAMSAAPVLRLFEITGIDRVIPNFPSLAQALAHRSANGPNGHQRPGGMAVGSEQNGLVAQLGTASLTEKPLITSPARVWPGVRRAGLPRPSGGADAGPAAPRAPRLI